jgi:hypothetical protein
MAFEGNVSLCGEIFADASRSAVYPFTLFGQLRTCGRQRQPSGREPLEFTAVAKKSLRGLTVGVDMHQMAQNGRHHT